MNDGEKVFTITLAFIGKDRETVEADFREAIGFTSRGARIVVEEGEETFIEAARRVGSCVRCDGSGWILATVPSVRGYSITEYIPVFTEEWIPCPRCNSDKSKPLPQSR